MQASEAHAHTRAHNRRPAGSQPTPITTRQVDWVYVHATVLKLSHHRAPHHRAPHTKQNNRQVMASCRLLTSALRLRLAPSPLMLAARALSTTVRSGGPPGSGFTTTITTPDPTHTLPPPGLSSMREPMPPAPIYTAAVAVSVASGEGGGTAKQHSGASSGHAHRHHHPVEMGATAQREDREERRMVWGKEGSRIVCLCVIYIFFFVTIDVVHPSTSTYFKYTGEGGAAQGEKDEEGRVGPRGAGGRGGRGRGHERARAWWVRR